MSSLNNQTLYTPQGAAQGTPALQIPRIAQPLAQQAPEPYALYRSGATEGDTVELGNTTAADASGTEATAAPAEGDELYNAEAEPAKKGFPTWGKVALGALGVAGLVAGGSKLIRGTWLPWSEKAVANAADNAAKNVEGGIEDAAEAAKTKVSETLEKMGLNATGEAKSILNLTEDKATAQKNASLKVLKENLALTGSDKPNLETYDIGGRNFRIAHYGDEIEFGKEGHFSAVEAWELVQRGLLHLTDEQKALYNNVSLDNDDGDLARAILEKVQVHFGAAGKATKEQIEKGEIPAGQGIKVKFLPESPITTFDVNNNNVQRYLYNANKQIGSNPPVPFAEKVPAGIHQYVGADGKTYYKNANGADLDQAILSKMGEELAENSHIHQGIQNGIFTVKDDAVKQMILNNDPRLKFAQIHIASPAEKGGAAELRVALGHGNPADYAKAYEGNMGNKLIEVGDKKIHAPKAVENYNDIKQHIADGRFTVNNQAELDELVTKAEAGDADALRKLNSATFHTEAPAVLGKKVRGGKEEVEFAGKGSIRFGADLSDTHRTAVNNLLKDGYVLTNTTKRDKILADAGLEIVPGFNPAGIIEKADRDLIKKTHMAVKDENTGLVTLLPHGEFDPADLKELQKLGLYNEEIMEESGKASDKRTRRFIDRVFNSGDTATLPLYVTNHETVPTFNSSGQSVLKGTAVYSHGDVEEALKPRP